MKKVRMRSVDAITALVYPGLRSPATVSIKTSNFHAVFSDHTVRIQKHHCSQPGCGWHSTPTITSLFGTNIHPDLATIQLSLSRLNHWWPEWEVSPAMMEGAAADHRRVQRGLKGG